MQEARLARTNEGTFLVFIENDKDVVTIYEVGAMKNTLEEYEELIWKWACERGLDKSTPVAQATKTMEEAKELHHACVFNNKDDAMDAVGDVFVTLVICARLLGVNLLECVKTAYNQIKDRKGKVVDGIFVKEE